MSDFLHSLEPRRAISPAAAVTNNTPLVSQVIDRQGFETLTFIILLGALADADATFAVTVEHSDAQGFSGAEVVPAAQLLGNVAAASFTFADDNKTRKIGYAGDKRYVRLTVTPTGNTGDAFIAATALLGRPHVAPTANPPV